MGKQQVQALLPFAGWHPIGRIGAAVLLRRARAQGTCIRTGPGRYKLGKGVAPMGWAVSHLRTRT